MRRSMAGIGLIELMVAMTLGLVITLGVTQIFLTAKNTYRSQSAAAAIQEDARFILSKMIQEVRSVGMFGCLATVQDSSKEGDFAAAFATPITVTRSSNGNVVLTLVYADVGENGPLPTWQIRSDCKFSATAYTGGQAPALAVGQLTFPIRRVVYSYSSNSINVGPKADSVSPLINNVSQFDVTFGMASNDADEFASSYVATPTNFALIRSVRIALKVTDGNATALAREQSFSVVASIRNRLL